MPRPRKTEAPDQSHPLDLTRAAIERMTCPPDRLQVFYRDKEGNGLRVRVTRTGRKTFVFEQSLHNGTIRKPIGNVETWSVEEARTAAKRLSLLVDKGTDPRELDREEAERKARERAAAAAQDAAQTAKDAAEALPVAEAWARYLAERRPLWRERTYFDHEKMTRTAGRERRNRPGVLTVAGPLVPLMGLRLVDLTPTAVEAWAAKEAKVRPARVRLALRLLKAFLRWAAAEPDLQSRVNADAAASRKAREAAGRAGVKNDVLLREQLSAWFVQVRAIGNPVIAAYLQGLLLLGCRREELARLRWDDINWQWKGIALADKLDAAGRQVPLTPYLASLLAALPRRNEWVFSSTRTVSMAPKVAARRARYHERMGTDAPAGAVVQASASGRLVDPSIAHRQACAAAGIEGLTLHGLRRSFASLTEWLEIPAGVVAQIQGHKPSATAEKHYKRRPLDLLRVHHERIEAWILKEAGIDFKPATAGAGGLRAVV